MSIAIISPGRDVSSWVKTFNKADPTVDIQIFPDIGDKESVELVILWQHPKGILKEFPNLKLICSMGAGVDHILSDPEIPLTLPITRIVDPGLTVPMTNYVVMATLNYQRQLYRYQSNQKKKIWDMSNPELDLQVGVMGVGALGGDVIEKLKMLGFSVFGYGNSPKSSTDYPYFYGDELPQFLNNVNLIICMLPLTPSTENILNLDFFRKCKKGTYIINVARGSHLVEDDLVTAIGEGIISGAFLDVFRKEPLPQEHPFWNSDKITVTPHIASVTNPNSAIPQIIENYKRIKSKKKLLNQINPILGY
ncbi:2-hydroxyacid dehydrogenase [Cognataquiflexum rubidum]|uniref:2-hydroxyacid dehydrogenase n=1 Tax=Cognataquiflexum rubidum TaxID=2922273 RepID=UPI001F13ABBA|nr:glyoxylate/hydroxypyruvate reductase A [Cognataquiflexum rubidum]MCH6233698.1 glyoxylate/hydroxypyruvate reductase A [Cognataquiflexum rubidum]